MERAEGGGCRRAGDLWVVRVTLYWEGGWGLGDCGGSTRSGQQKAKAKGEGGKLGLGKHLDEEDEVIGIRW